MYVCFGVVLSSRLYECIYKVIVLLPTNTWLFDSKIQIIIEELLVVSPAVEDNGKGSIWVDSCTEGG